MVSYTTLLVLQDQGLWGFAVPLSKHFVEFPIKSAKVQIFSSQWCQHTGV